MSISKIFKKEIICSGGYKGGRAMAEPKPGGKRIFKLSSNENFFGCSHRVLEAVKKATSLFNFYPSSTPQPLYEALAKSYQNQLSEDHFIAGNSGSELLEIICRAFLYPTSNCIISSPCFSPYQMFSSWTGATIQDIPLLKGAFALDAEGILNAIDQDTRLIFLTSPNNPTGSYIPRQQLSDFISRVPEHVVVVFDEVYHHFTNADDYTTAQSFILDGYPVIAINSFSKAYGLASLRIGYGYSTIEITQYLRKLIRPFLINKLSMTAALAALSDTPFLEHTVEQIIEQREILVNGIDSMGLRCWPSQANFVLVAVPDNQHDFIIRMEKEGIMVRGGESFGAPGCVRITIGDKDATQATLSALATIIAS